MIPFSFIVRQADQHLSKERVIVARSHQHVDVIVELSGNVWFCEEANDLCNLG